MLALERGALVGDVLDVGELDRQAAARVLDAPARVRGEAACDVVGAAAIQGVVGAAQQIHAPGSLLH